jgi:cytidylate kinase
MISPSVFFITGCHFVGKTSCAATLSTELGLPSIDCGPFLRQCAKDRGFSGLDRFVADGEARVGHNFTNHLLLARALQILEGQQGVIVTGSRSVHGLRYIERGIARRFPNMKASILYLEADLNTLWTRFRLREKSGSRAQFEELLLRDRLMGVEEISAVADFRLDSSRSINETSKEISWIIRRATDYKASTNPPFESLHMSDILAFVESDSVINDSVRKRDPLGISLSVAEGLEGGIEASLSHVSAFVGDQSRLDELAAARDIRLLTSAAVTLGHPGRTLLSEAMVEISNRSAEYVRDTFIDYVLRNPLSVYMRTFSGSDVERVFIRGASGIDFSLRSAGLALLLAIDTGDPTTLPVAIDELRNATRILRALARIVTPEVFAIGIRTYFDPFDVAGRNLTGPHGGQSSICLLDAIGLGVAPPSVNVRELIKGSAASLPSPWASILQTISSRVSERLHSDHLSRTGLVDGLIDTSQAIRKFRLVHRGLARASFTFRTVGSVGSGGFPPEALDGLILGEAR